MKNIKSKNINKKDQWILAEDIPNCDLFFSHIWLYGFVRQFGKHTGRAYSKILCHYNGYHLWFYFGDRDSFEVGEQIAGRIINEKDYANNININIVRVADKLRKYSQTIPQKNLSQLTNKELWNIYNKQDKIHQDYYTWAWIPVGADMFHNNLTNRVKNYLKQIGVPKDKLTEYYITLTQPTEKSLIFIEQQDLLKIGEKIQSSPSQSPKILSQLLEKHRQKYFYTKFLWVEGEYTLEDYRKQLKDILRGEEKCRDIIIKQNQELKKNAKRKRDLIRQLKLSKQWQDIFNAFGDFMVTKIYRRYAQIFAMYQMNVILNEIAGRFYLTAKQVRFMLPQEVQDMLLNNKYDAQVLLKRTKQCVYYLDDREEKILVGKDAEKLIKQVETKFDSDIKELRGEIGCPGYGKGKVKIIIRAEDMQKMETGDVLVSIATDPDIVPAMKKAAAIVTEQGGVTSHAAIVSRELGIPCVIGTKIAARVLKDGDLVEVDANKGIVKKIIDKK